MGIYDAEEAIARRDRQDEITQNEHQQSQRRLNTQLEQLQKQLRESSKTQLQHQVTHLSVADAMQLGLSV